jgi:putative hydrolase of the HAD superfamily
MENATPPAPASPRRAVARDLLRLVAIQAVISDFGGVLTTPLFNSFAAFQDETGIPVGALGRAMQRISERDGAHPLFQLERGKLAESEFLDLMRMELAVELGHEPELHRFSEIYFEALDPNEAMIELMRDLKRRAYRMALLTNNVREWEPLWRAMLPVDEIFELVVDSAFTGMRKPDREIYELTLERLGGIEAESCLFVDDVEVNVAAARELGMDVVHFQSNEQAIPEIEAALS